MKKKVAIIGTNGIPARYGGFETLADNLTKELQNEYDFTVYCSSIYLKKERTKNFNGSRLKYLPLKANGIQSLIYDFFCYVHASLRSKTILFLGPTPSGIITLLNCIFRKKIIVNHGGLNEWEREKYSNSEKKWAKLNHFIAARNATINITDNTVLQKSLKESFDASSVVIRYGGNHFSSENDNLNLHRQYPFIEKEYFLCVARAQIDNNLHIIIEAFREMKNVYPLVIVSNWNVSDYGKKLKQENENHENLILLDAIYDINIFNGIRRKCYVYIHSHSYCGTAPSLVEAMSLNLPIFSFDVPTNRETTREKALYFSSKENLQELVTTVGPNELQSIRESLNTIAVQEYSWREISQQYSKIL